MYRFICYFFFSSRRRHTRSYGDWSSDVCSSDLAICVVGAVMGVLFAWSHESPRWLALASVPILLCVGLGAVTLPEWEKKPLSFGPYEPSRLGAGPEALTRPNDQLLYFREGRTATI